jgi:hypothetical protein
MGFAAPVRYACLRCEGFFLVDAINPRPGRQEVLQRRGVRLHAQPAVTAAMMGPHVE